MLLVFTGVISCSKQSSTAATPVVDSNVTPSYRPLYHFTPDINWTNDPNGLVYYQGAYHLFHQYNPLGNEWGNMSWGHATSTDLFNWNHQPLALAKYFNNYDSLTDVFSGTAVVDSFNTSGFGTTANPSPLIAIFTSNVENGVQNQSLAYSLDGTTFTRYANNPIVDINSNAFRDPKVFWYAATQRWIMIVSKPDIQKVYFYNSQDLKHWTYLSAFGGIGNVNQVWECPDIFPLQVNGNGPTKWVITISGGGPQVGFGGMQYFIGSFDGNSFTADPLAYPLYLDYGKDFYAGITYNNIPTSDGRRIMIGWANNWAYASLIPTVAYRGMMSVPRSLQLVQVNGQYLLTQMPVTETDKYKGATVFQLGSLVLNNSTNDADTLKGDALDIEFTLSPGSALQSGVRVFTNGLQQTAIYYNQADNSIKLDRTHSGNVAFSNLFQTVESAPLLAGTNSTISVKILTDKSLIEVFVNNGQGVITDQVYPNAANGGIEFFSQGGTATFNNITVNKMNASLVN